MSNPLLIYKKIPLLKDAWRIHREAYLMMAKMRAARLRIQSKGVGKEVYIKHGCNFINPQKLRIGSHVYINHHCEFGTTAEITIGSYVLIGPYCSFLTSNHGFDDYETPMVAQKEFAKPIIIEDDVWIGTRATILQGVRIGRGSIIAANAVVTKDVEPYSIVAGVPARIIRFRFDKETIQKALRIDFSQQNWDKFYEKW